MSLQEADILRKLQANRASTTDLSGHTINVGDYITLVDTGGAVGQLGAGGMKKERGGVCRCCCWGPRTQVQSCWWISSSILQCQRVVLSSFAGNVACWAQYRP